MSRGFTGTYRSRAVGEGPEGKFMMDGQRRECLPAIEKDRTALEGREGEDSPGSADWVCQDLANTAERDVLWTESVGKVEWVRPTDRGERPRGSCDVAGSEAGNCSIGWGGPLMSNMLYFIKCKAK